MSESYSHPPIEPNEFDLIVVGTGLSESVTAAAASAIGKTVLHVDPNPFYGSHFASLPIAELTAFLNSHSTPPQPGHQTQCEDYTLSDFTLRSLFSDVEVSSFAHELLSENSRSFSVDLGGPRVFFCADRAIDLIVRSGASHYVEFKGVDVSFVCDDGGKLWSVPDSRAAIFKDRTLSLTEKNQLMRFFKLVQRHLEGSDEESGRISDEDLESPFVEFLKKMRLPPKIESIILYAIAMADYDQSDLQSCKDILKTKDGIERLALYNKSVGRFPNAPGALIYPIYGQGELSQAFCRRAAVKGCLYVLRMPVSSLLTDKESGKYRGVKLGSGQDVFSNQLVLDPAFVVTPSPLEGSLEGLNLGGVKGKVARGICVVASSLKPDISNFIIIYPPRSLYPEQKTSVRALQIGSGLATCPSGMFILYFSALCDDGKQGKGLLRAAMNALLSIPVSENTETNSESQRENEVKPALLWSATYIQELTTYSRNECEGLVSAPMPDGNLNYNELLDSAMKLFQNMYPGEEFFPVTTASENGEDDGEPS